MELVCQWSARGRVRWFTRSEPLKLPADLQSNLWSRTQGHDREKVWCCGYKWPTLVFFTGCLGVVGPGPQTYGVATAAPLHWWMPFEVVWVLACLPNASLSLALLLSRYLKHVGLELNWNQKVLERHTIHYMMGAHFEGQMIFFPYWKTIGLSFPHACFYYFSPHIQYFDPFVEWNQNLNKNLKFYYLLKFNLTFNIITFSFAQIVSPLVVTVCQQHDECFGKVLFSSSTELLEVILFDMFIKKSFISGSKNTKGLNSPGEHIEPNHSQYSYLQFKPQIDEDDK